MLLSWPFHSFFKPNDCTQTIYFRSTVVSGYEEEREGSARVARHPRHQMSSLFKLFLVLALWTPLLCASSAVELSEADVPPQQSALAMVSVPIGRTQVMLDRASASQNTVTITPSLQPDDASNCLRPGPSSGDLFPKRLPQPLRC